MWISGLKGLNNLVKSQLGRLITRLKKAFQNKQHSNADKNTF